MNTESATSGMSRLDPATAIANLGDDRELYAQIGTLFLEDCEVQRAALDAALPQGDYATAKRAAHTIKGTAGAVGALRLQHLAHAVELACATADPAAINAADAAMRTELAAASTTLREYLARR